VIAGLLVGLVAMFRQLSGVWAAMATLIVALTEADDGLQTGRPLLSRFLAATMLMVVVTYCVSTRDWFGPLLVASPAAALLLWMTLTLRTGTRATLRVVCLLLAGAVVAAFPLLVYHSVHGSVRPWLSDITGAAVGLTQLNFFGQPWYLLAVVGGLRNLIL